MIVDNQQQREWVEKRPKTAAAAENVAPQGKLKFHLAQCLRSPAGLKQLASFERRLEHIILCLKAIPSDIVASATLADQKVIVHLAEE